MKDNAESPRSGSAKHGSLPDSPGTSSLKTYQVVAIAQSVEVVGQHPATHELPNVVKRHVLSYAQAKVESSELG